jgi:DNA-binding transcriptional ArsR family regulator
MDPELLRDVKILTGLARLRILGRLADGPADPGTLSASLGLSRRAIVRELGLLAVGGYVEPVDPTDPAGTWVLRPHGLMDVGRRLDALEPDASADGPMPSGASPEDSKVLRSFVEGGRLVSIPAHEKKREVILDWLLARCFVDDRDYPEREVDAILAEVNEDTASLRRYLVDTGRMTRSAGIYRRGSPPSADG